MPGAETRMMSAFSPARSLFWSAPVVSMVKSSMLPVFFANSAPISLNGCDIAPPIRSFNWAACALLAIAKSAKATNDFFNIGILLIERLPLDRRPVL
jgi:hypothetical protein